MNYPHARSKDTNINIRLSSHLKVAITDAADESHTSLTDFVEQALAEKIAANGLQQANAAAISELKAAVMAKSEALQTAIATIAAYEALAAPFNLMGKIYTQNGQTVRIETPYQVLQALVLHIKTIQK